MLIGLGIGLPFASAISLAAQIAALFAAGEQGAWYDPSDWSTLFQDSAGTLPVTAVGQPVGKMLDKSGRGNHATQPTAINRPVVQQDGSGRYYLSFNGTNSWMSTGSIDFTATDKMTVVAGVRKLTSEDYQTILQLSVDKITNTGIFALEAANPGDGNGTYYTSKGTVSQLYLAANTPPVTTVIAASSDISGDSVTLRFNGAQMGSNTSDQGTGNYGNHVLYVGANGYGGTSFNGRLYSLIIRGAQSTDAQIVSAETYVNSKTGAF